MAHNDDVERVLRKHRNAIKKVSRLEHKGIRIRNTDEYPYAKPDEIRNYSQRELAQHEAKLDAFTSRQRQYVPGADNAAIRKETLDRYIELQNRNNAIAEGIEAAIGKIKLPGEGDTTVETLMAMREKLTQKMNTQERFFEKINRGANNFTGEKAVQEALKEMERRQSNAFVNDRIERRLNSIRAALTYSGNVALVDSINNLSIAQKVFMIDYSNFGEIAANDINSPKYSSDGMIRDDYDEERDGVEEHPETYENLVTTLEWIRKNARAIGRSTRSSGLRLRKPGQ